MDDPMRWGILSTARIGDTQVVPAIARSTEAEVVAVGSRSVDSAADFADRHGIARAHGSYEELLADPEVDAVYNPLPNHLHLEWTLAALAAGKHVLCEKPLATTAADVRTMVGAAADVGLVVMEAFMYRSHPQWEVIHRLVDDGAIGEVRSVRGVFTYRNDRPDDIRNVAAYGGGGLLDIGCYPTNAIRWLLGSDDGATPDQVSARLTIDPRFGVDVVASAILDFGGRHGTFTVGTQLDPTQWLEIHGSEGRLTTPRPFNPPSDRPVVLSVHRGRDATEEVVVPAADQYRRMIEAFARSVVDGAPMPTPGEDSIANAAVLDEIRAVATV